MPSYTTTITDADCCCECPCDPDSSGCAGCPASLTLSGTSGACESFPITFTNSGGCNWSGSFAHLLKIGRNEVGGCYCANLTLIANGQATYTYYGTDDPCVTSVTMTFVASDGICEAGAGTWPATLTLGP